LAEEQSGDDPGVRALPLGRLSDITERWGDDWDQAGDQLAQVARDACKEQLHNGQSLRSSLSGALWRERRRIAPSRPVRLNLAMVGFAALQR
jgi:hypothetical protein